MIGSGWDRWHLKQKKGQSSGAQSGDGKLKKVEPLRWKVRGNPEAMKMHWFLTDGTHTPKWKASCLCGTNVIFFFIQMLSNNSLNLEKPWESERKIKIEITVTLSPGSISVL